MSDYSWPDEQHRGPIGKRVNRVDGPVKVTGRATYTYDVNSNGMLYGAILRCPHPRARVVSVDTTAAQKMSGVKAIKVLQGPGKEIHWAGDEIVALAAVDEPTAEDALRAIVVKYQTLPFLVSDAEPPQDVAVRQGPVSDEDLDDMISNQVPDAEIIARVQRDGIAFKPTPDVLKDLEDEEASQAVRDAISNAQVRPAAPKGSANWYKRASAAIVGQPDSAFQEASSVISEGVYGMPVITHCCLEPHGAVVQWTGPNELFVHISTQNVSGIPGQIAEATGLPATNIRVHQDHVGGGFGSKFAADRWTIAAAELSRMAGGKPVKMMLTRGAELEVAGARPSAYARVKVAAHKDGSLLAWQHQGWGTGGPGGGGSPPLPYVFDIPNRRTEYAAIVNHIGPARAWRAPNHPQACLITMAALDDLADKLEMDPLEFFTRNIGICGARAPMYRDELPIAAELMGWKEKWRPRKKNATAVPVRRGVGLSLHTWGGRGHDSNCDVTIHPDGAVEVKLGSQDLGTGTRTVITMVAAESLGIPMSQIKLLIGDTQYPVSGGSGGSSTVGGVSSSTRRAAVDARDQLLAKVAPALDATPGQLEIADGVVRVKDQPNKSFTWKQACARLGAVPLTVRGKNPDKSKPPDLTNSGVGGVQMAEVSVDVETGIVTVERMVAVQDCGLIIDLKTAESQVYGALIMGISYALFEEKIMDPATGRMLNPNMEFYRLAGIGDIPELVVHMMTGKGYDERGVIGLGEPPVVSPGAAISNAVANALGVRIPFLPLTPDRVLTALNAGRPA
ncbi:MAG: xanthine dehydrogenase family protein molybdopterin-binding subunit [Terriglobales bacterium]|jgi:xanthine dehydrogenase YagR molybdenum-binding subunit